MDDFGDKLGERLRQAADAKKLSIAKVAKHLDVSPASVSHYFNGRNEPKYAKLIKFSELVGVSVQDLLMPPSETEEPSVSDGEFVTIPVRNVELSAGSGAYPAEEEITGHLAFGRNWLRKRGITQDAASICRTFGNSMAPTILDGDMVMIDHRRTHPNGKEVFAIRLDNELFVKRLEVNLDDLSLFVHSDNPDFRTMHIPKNRRDENPIIGKVVWSARTWPT